MDMWLTAGSIATREHRRLFAGAKPFPHIVIPEFLHRAKAVALLRALAAERFYEKRSDLFQLQQTHDLATCKQPSIVAFREFLASKEFTTELSLLTGMKIKPGIIDMHGSLYQDTDFLLCHDDQLEGRKIAYLFYLTDMEEDEGGALQLLGSKKGQPSKAVTTIVPRFNTFACFAVSAASFHEVTEVLVKKQRIALGGWFHG